MGGREWEGGIGREGAGTFKKWRHGGHICFLPP